MSRDEAKAFCGNRGGKLAIFSSDSIVELLRMTTESSSLDQGAWWTGGEVVKRTTVEWDGGEPDQSDCNLWENVTL